MTAAERTAADRPGLDGVSDEQILMPAANLVLAPMTERNRNTWAAGAEAEAPSTA